MSSDMHKTADTQTVIPTKENKTSKKPGFLAIGPEVKLNAESHVAIEEFLRLDSNSTIAPRKPPPPYLTKLGLPKVDPENNQPKKRTHGRAQSLDVKSTTGLLVAPPIPKLNVGVAGRKSIKAPERKAGGTATLAPIRERAGEGRRAGKEVINKGETDRLVQLERLVATLQTGLDTQIDLVQQHKATIDRQTAQMEQLTDRFRQLQQTVEQGHEQWSRVPAVARNIVLLLELHRRGQERMEQMGRGSE